MRPALELPLWRNIKGCFDAPNPCHTGRKAVGFPVRPCRIHVKSQTPAAHPAMPGIYIFY